MLNEEKIEHSRSERSVSFHGVSIDVFGAVPTYRLEIYVDPGIADVALPRVERIIRKIRSEGVRGISIRFDFISTVECLTDHHKISGRVYGTNIKLSAENRLILGDIEFYVSYSYSFRPSGDTRRGATFINMRFECDELRLSQIRELLEFLFEREILYIAPRLVEYGE